MLSQSELSVNGWAVVVGALTTENCREAA
jgi:hypothetical protein